MFYPSKVYRGTKTYPYFPEKINGCAMANPIYKITLWDTINKPKVICDSGAFQDIDKHMRLTPENALIRQKKYETFLQNIYGQNWKFEAICIYDQMIGVDEAIEDGKKIKKRGTVESAKLAVQDTLNSAAYYKSQEQYIETLMYIAQGIDRKQYIGCVEELMCLSRTTDYFGFGGFCIIGRQRKQMLPLFFDVFENVMPILQKKGIKRAHLLGVCLPEAVQFAVRTAKKFNIVVSTDSSAPEVNAIAFGKGYNEDARPSVRLGDKWIDYNPIYSALHNITIYSEWMNNL